MNRKILIQVAAPAIAVGLLLLGACLMSAWYVHRLQTNLASILSENVTSQEAAQALEIRVRQLRFHSFMYLLDPTPERRKLIEQDHELFEEALNRTRESANTDEENRRVQEIETGYQHYHKEIDLLLAAAERGGSRMDMVKLADAHPVRHVVEPSQELLRVNKNMMEKTSAESQRVANQANFMLILLGLVGPFGGLFIGFWTARGLSHSIYRLGVQVRDMAHRLDEDVASVWIQADGDLANLDRQLQHVVQRVEEVTERQQRHQREMLRAEQLAAVGQLAAGVAHEVRNPLTSVKMLVEAALRSNNQKPLTADDLRVIHREVARLETTVQGFLDFARLPTPQRSVCDLRAVLAEAIELVTARARQQAVKIDVLSPESEAAGYVDPGQVRTVLVNLFLNALDAMPNGGHLEVRLEGNTEAGFSFVVADTGCGIPSELHDRLFMPFATTKPTGTGLGLSMSRRIVEEHGGQLTGANRTHGGAAFRLWLPPSDAPPISTRETDAA